MNEEVIFNLTPEQREEMIKAIITKVSTDPKMKDDTKTRNTKWKNKEFVRQVILDYVKLLTVKRNAMIVETEGLITEKEAFAIIYRNFNFRNKPNPKKAEETLKILDEYMPAEGTNKVFKGFPKIVTTASTEVKNRLEILRKYGYIPRIIENPKKLMASSSWIDSRLAYYENLIRIGSETRKLFEIPASEILSDKVKMEKTEKAEEKEDYEEEEGR